MKLNWNIEFIPALPLCSHIMNSKLERMRRNIEQSGRVNISVLRRTKTTLDIRMSYLDDSFAVAYIPKGGEHLKYVEATSYSFFDSASSTRYYLRVSKRQNIDALKEYLSLVLAEMELNVDVLQVDLKIFGIEELKTA